MTASDPPRPRFADEGVQASRTTLSWQRTALSLVGTAAALLKFVAPRAGLWAIVACVVASVVALGALRVVRVRYHRTVEAVYRDVHGGSVGEAMPGGGLPAALAAVSVALGLISIWSFLV
jgi:hypothetical protein